MQRERERKRDVEIKRERRKYRERDCAGKREKEISAWIFRQTKLLQTMIISRVNWLIRFNEREPLVKL